MYKNIRDCYGEKERERFKNINRLSVKQIFFKADVKE